MKKFPLLSAIVFSFILSSCSSPLHRGPASDSTLPTDLGEAVRQFRGFVQSDELTATSCAPRLSAIYNELYNIPASHFDRSKLEKEALEVVQNLWETRLDLRKRLAQWARQKSVTPECEVAVRKAFVAARFLEEYIGEWKLKPAAPDPEHPMPSWSGSFPYIVQAPGLSGIELKSGDILISRGNAFTSAAIARVGDVEGQFSHLALVHIDENGKIWTIEAEIEVGVIIHSIDQYNAEGNVRSALFRYPDSALATKAAKLMYDRTRAAIQAGANIPYNFSFDPDDKTQIFCAQVASMGYGEASGGALKMPLFPSKITKKHREFLNDIGLSTNETFAPMDMEMDTRFEFLAEWRDLSRIHQSHLKDSLLTQSYAWMERDHYVLRKTPLNRIKSGILWQVRRWPIFGEMLKDRFPTNMPVSLIEAIFSLNDAIGTLFDELSARDDAHRDETGLWMTPKEMQNALEQIRTEDLARWRRWRGWQFRQYLHPNERKQPRPQPERPHFHDIFRGYSAN